jgi:hypothetical protein
VRLSPTTGRYEIRMSSLGFHSATSKHVKSMTTTSTKGFQSFDMKKNQRQMGNVKNKNQTM